MGTNRPNTCLRTEGIANATPATRATPATPYRAMAGSGSEIAPKASRPAHTAKVMSINTCTMMPAAKFNPTLETATAGSTPVFWMNRVLSAMPPSPAGASLLAKEEATCANRVGPVGSRFLTEPMTARVAPTKVRAAASIVGANHHQLALPTRLMMSPTFPNCGIKKYVANARVATMNRVRRLKRSSCASSGGSVTPRCCTVARSSSRRCGCSLSAARVAPASAPGWSSGRARQIGSGPSALSAESVARSGPTAIASETSSCAVSPAIACSSAATSPKPKSTSHGPSSDAIRLFSRRFRCVMRWFASICCCCQICASTSSLISDFFRRSSGVPATAVYTSSIDSSPTATTVRSSGVRTWVLRARRATSASCSALRRKLENGRSSPTFLSRTKRYARNRRSADRSSGLRTLAYTRVPSSRSAK